MLLAGLSGAMTMTKKPLVALAVLIGAGVVAFAVFRKPASAPFAAPPPGPAVSASPSAPAADRGIIIEAEKGIIQNINRTELPAPTPKPSVASELPSAVINVTARQWAFEPSTIRVKLGQKATLNITSIDVAHGIGIPDFGVNANLEAGKTTAVTFTPDKIGSFAFFCSVFCGTGHKDMKGTLIVE